MFDWIKDNLVNSADAVVDVNDRLLIKRRGEYKPEYVKDGKVYKTAGYNGSNAVMTINCSGIIVPESGLFQATLKIKMYNKFLGEYANANWALFGRPVLVGFEVASNASADQVAQALADALNAAIPENNRFMVVEVEGSTVSICLPDCYADFESFALESYDSTACDSCLGEYNRVEMGDNAVEITHNVEPFATGEWIRENLRFPSYPNMRYAPMYADEQPIPGAVYNMYAFKYDVPEVGHGGLSFVGQDIVSDTTHVFYVLAGDTTTAFESKLAELGLNVVSAHVHADNDGATGVAEPLHPNGASAGATA